MLDTHIKNVIKDIPEELWDKTHLNVEFKRIGVKRLDKIEVLKDFKLENEVPEELIKNYQNSLPNELLRVWKEYGFGTFLKGYLKIINPDEYNDLLEISYQRHNNAVPFMVTSMGDILIWEKNKYIKSLNYRKGYVEVISAGFDYFFEDLLDMDDIGKELQWRPYPDAVKKYGEPTYDECFGYVPLLGLGGSEKVGNLQKVKLREHVLLITEFMGPIE